MEIGEVIRRYRKRKNMTQEEMADRLGVSGPAVNKWEKGNSFPDITLLAPIARLLDITPDVLLSFREEMTRDEINGLVAQADRMLLEGSFKEAFLWAKGKVEQYPDCEELMLNMAAVNFPPFSVFFAIFHDLNCVFLIFRDFQFSCHIPVCLRHECESL